MIRFDGPIKRFADHTVIGPLTFEIRAGEVTALLGPNGSGKTTSLKMAAGLIKPDAGTVTVGDPPQPSWRPAARTALSYLPQRVSFPDALSGAEVVEFYRRLRGAPVESGPAALRFASLNGAGARPISTYSGGMHQRLGLAVALLPGAAAVLLDEPTAALDPEGLQAFYKLAEDRRRDRGTVFFTSHQVGDVERLADRIIVMARGRLLADFTRAELLRWLDARGVMRIRTRAGDAALAAARRVAPDASMHDNEIVVVGPSDRRAAVLDALRSAAAPIDGLLAENGRVDTLYAELIGAAAAGDGA